MTQAQLAEAGRTSQPTIAAYERGAKSPTLRTLRRLAAAAGFEVAVDFVPPLTREEARSLTLHGAIAERLAAAPGGVIARARSNLDTMRATNPRASDLLDEWQAILDRPVEEIVRVLSDRGERARELRHVTPFAGVLTGAERAALYRAFRHAEAAA